MALVEDFQSEQAYFKRQGLTTFLCNYPVETHKFTGMVESNYIVDSKEYSAVKRVDFNKKKNL